MISKLLDRISFVAIFLVIVLLPVFFLPFLKIPIETSKGLLLVLGVAVAVIFWAVARFFDGKVLIPRSMVLVSGLGIVFSFLLSTIFSPAKSASLFGVMFDVGTFLFVFASFLLMFITSMVVRNTKQARFIFSGFVVSATILMIFQFIHIFAPAQTSFGVLPSKIDNVIGSWSALGIFASLLSVMSLFLIEFLSISKRNKIFLSVLLVLSLIFTAIINLSLSWILLGIFSLVVFVFKVVTYSHLKQSQENEAHFPVLPLFVVILAILFFVSGGMVRGFLPTKLGISNTEVSPSLKTTLFIAKDTLKTDPLFGSGPNRFKDMWAMHKPASINNSQFWNADFDFGSGLIPTFAVTTGLVGILAWLFFFYVFIRAGLSSMSSTIKDSSNPESSAFFLASIFLFLASFFYPVGGVMFFLAFAFAGVFVGLSGAGVLWTFLGNQKKSIVSIVFLVLIILASVISSFKYLERFVSVSYFGRALSALATTPPNIPVAEQSIAKAITLNQNDFYLRAYAQIYLTKLGATIAENKTPSDELKAQMQDTLDRAVAGADLASKYNPTNYINFRALGIVYDSLASIGVPDASKKAVESYQKAFELNPLNPGIKIAIARSYLLDGNTKEAKASAEQALTLKPNYIEGLVVLSQIYAREGNRTQALSYAEKALSLSPGEKSLIDYVNSLK